MKFAIPVSALLAVALLPAPGCITQGNYTQASEEEARANMAVLRSGTQYDQANQFYRTGDLDQALEAIETSLAMNDHVAKSHLLRGHILIELARPQEALDALAQGSLIDPTDSRFAYYRGFVFEQLGLVDLALTEFLSAVELEGNLAQNRLAAAEVLIELGRADEARALLVSESGIFSAHPGFRQAMGHIQLLEGDLTGAVRSFTEATVLSPGDPALLEDLCRVQVAAEQYSQAEATLRHLAEEGGYAKRPDLKRLHAMCLLQLNRPVEARKILMELTSTPGGAHDLEAWNGLVDVALMLRDDRLLRSAADRLLASAPERHDGYLALAMWQRRTADLKGALESTRFAIQRAGDDPTPRKLEELLVRQIAEQKSEPGPGSGS